MASITTESGREFTATTNHPMLTDRGWVGAGELNEGDDLICCERQQDLGVVGDQDVTDGPATIAEVFESAAVVGIVERRTGREDDFHGDGREGEVDIAWPNRELHVGVFAALAQHDCHLLFTEADRSAATFCPKCSLLLSIDEQACLCGVSGGYPVIGKNSPDRSLAGSDHPPDRFGRPQVFYVQPDYLDLIQVAPQGGGSTAMMEKLTPGLAQITHDSGFVNDLFDSPRRAADALRDVGAREAVYIETDKVVSVKIVPYAGHVYNLTTPNGYFVANGCYTGNTELTALVNERSVVAAQKAFPDGVSKIWLTVGDNRVRKAHANAQGQTVPIDQPFLVGGASLMYPGDPMGPLRLVARCRCRLSYTNDPVAITASGRPDVSELAMVAVYPTPDEQEAIAVEGGNDAETMHCTMVFLGDAAEIDMEAAGRAVARVARNTPAMSGRVGGVGMFAGGPDGFPALAIPNVSGLSMLRARLVDALAAEGVESPSEHDWVPHMTVAYNDSPMVPDLAVIGSLLTFDSVSLVVADERTDFALGTLVASVDAWYEQPDPWYMEQLTASASMLEEALARNPSRVIIEYDQNAQVVPETNNGVGWPEYDREVSYQVKFFDWHGYWSNDQLSGGPPIVDMSKVMQIAVLIVTNPEFPLARSTRDRLERKGLLY